MKRLAIHLAIALLTFSIGVVVWFAHPLKRLKSQPTEPLLVTLSSKKQPSNSRAAFDHVVTIKNVGTKTIQGYSLGFKCNCRGWDSDDNFYPEGINFTNPNPERQVLHPGESQTMVFDAEGLPANESGQMVWADLVHFKGGANWGPNQSHKEGYVRE
jgi:hypothetical protein